MNKGYSYIVASDLDGTLLGKGDTVSEENIAAIKEMKNRGICFVPNSGRAFSEMPKAVIEDPDIRYYIGSDGAAIWDKETGERLGFCMSRETVAPVIDMLESYSTLITARSNGRSYAEGEKCCREGYERYRVSSLYGMFIDYYVEKKESFSSFIRGLGEIEMICVFFSYEDEKEECRRRVEALGEFVVASSEPTNLEIFHKSAGKGSALLALADRLGVPHERTVAVGDGENDMDMIKKAGISLAMGNAAENLKAVASRVICRCEEHSAKYILENIVK